MGKRAISLAWIPNAVTSGNLLLGFYSIFVSVRALHEGRTPGAPEFAVACWLILWACIGDVLDGKLAKLLHASSEFGMYLDTFADAVTFGMAPAILLYAAFLRDPGRSLGVALAPLLYFLCACFRLARYNVQTTGVPRFGFVGVPTPAGAMICTSLYLGFADAGLSPGFIAALTALVALSMVSPLRYPAFKGLRRVEAVAVLALLCGMMASTILFGAPKTVFYVFSSFALVWGWLWIPLRPWWVPGVTAQD
jgi:CDP-diacylglycerol--serine O-phosphatidyltransferase